MKNKSKFLAYIPGMLLACLCICLPLKGLAITDSNEGSSEKVNVATPGTLEDLMADVESTRISSLTITGALDAYDIAYIIAHQGKMSKVKHLDISGITLVAGDHPYARYMIHKSAELTGGITGIFYISDTYHDEYQSITSPLGGSADTYKVYSPDLAGAFAHTQFSSIVLPDFLTKIPQYMFQDSEYIESIKFPQGVNEIEKYAFAGCTKISSIPESGNIVRIGEGAFKNSSVTSFNSCNVNNIGKAAFEGSSISGNLDLSLIDNIPENLLAESNIESVTFSPGLLSIGKDAFRNAKSLKKALLPEGLTSIADGAFAGCSALSEVTLPTSIKELAANAFEGTPYSNSFTNENGVIYVNDIAFRFDFSAVPNPKTIVIKEGCTSIAESFIGNDGYASTGSAASQNITSIIFPSSLKRIGKNAFPNLSNLGKIEFPDALEHIGDGAFWGCKSMYFDKLPSSVTHIGYEAFRKCDLTEVTLPENLAYIASSAFLENDITTVRIYSRNLDLRLSEEHPQCIFKNVTKVVVGAEVKAIPSAMFSENQSLRKLEFEPRQIPISFGNSAFGEDTEMTAINFPENVELVGEGAFSGCTNLTLDAGVLTNAKYIGDYGFAGCQGLVGDFSPIAITTIGKSALNDTGISSAVIPETLTFIGSSSFSDCKNLKTFRYYANAQSGGSIFYSGRQVVITPRPFSTKADNEDSSTRLDSLTIGRNVVSIPSRIFSNASLGKIIFEGYEENDPSVVSPGSFTIGEGAFYESDISSFTSLPTNTVSIGKEAFRSDYIQQKSIVIPASVKELGQWACNRFEEAYLYPQEPPTCNYSLPKKVFVNYNSLNAYLADPTYAEYEIKAMPGSEPEAPVQITLPKTEIGTQKGSSFRLEAKIYPEDARNKELKWVSTNPEVATVDNNGLVTALKYGATCIEVSSVAAPDVMARCMVFVSDPDFVSVKNISFPEEIIRILVGQEILVEPEVIPWDATPGQLEFISASTEIFAVDQRKGNLIGKKAGSALLTVRSIHNPEVKAEVIIVVSDPVPVSSIKLGYGNIEMVEGGSLTMDVIIEPEDATDKSVTWRSSNTDVADIDSKTGLLRALQPGEAIISATTNDGSNLSAQTSVIVESKKILIQSIKLDRKTINLHPGDETAIIASVTPENATNKTLEWQSDAPEVATIDRNGNLRAISPGRAIISCHTTDGSDIHKNCEVNVDEPVVLIESFRFAYDHAWMEIGETKTLHPEITPENATNKDIRWISNDETIATVDNNGMIYALSPGKVDIFGFTTDGSELSYGVTFEVKPNFVSIQTIEINPEEVVLYPGDEVTITATIMPENATNQTLEWESDSNDVATVDAHGKITAISPGTATIYCHTTDGSNLQKACKAVVNSPVILATSISLNYADDI